MTAIHIKGSDGVTDATRAAMREGWLKFRKYLADRINPNVKIQPDGSCIFRAPGGSNRPPLSGHVCGPDGRPAILAMVEEHNRQNRARLYDRVRGWERAFPRGREYDILGVRFKVHRHDLPDVLVLEPLYPLSRDHLWSEWFESNAGRYIPVNGYTLRIQDGGCDQLMMQVVGV